MNLFDPFHFFWQVAGIDKDIVTAGFYANTELSPQVHSLPASSIKSKLQEYIKSRVGSTLFQRYFADWAGHNCANMDYLTREQVGNQFCKKKQFCGKNYISTSADCWRSPWLGIGPCSDRLCGKESTRWDFVSFV